MPSGNRNVGAKGKANGKGLQGWHRDELIEEVRRLRAIVKGEPLPGGEAPPEKRFGSKADVIQELYRLYNEEDVPWNQRKALLVMIAQEEHGMFEGGKGNGKRDWADFFRGIGTKQLDEELARRPTSKPS